jgi:hypothetical protein
MRNWILALFYDDQALKANDKAGAIKQKGMRPQDASLSA